jgi:hypothetical protein
VSLTARVTGGALVLTATGGDKWDKLTSQASLWMVQGRRGSWMGILGHGCEYARVAAGRGALPSGFTDGDNRSG